jgi:hypothetical protein
MGWWCVGVVEEVVSHQGTHEFGGVVKVEGGDDVHTLVQVKLKDPGVVVLVVVKPTYKVVDGLGRATWIE